MAQKKNRRDPRRSTSILTPPRSAQHGRFRRKPRPEVNPPPFESKTGVISQELVSELQSLAVELGMPLDEFNLTIPPTMLGGRRKLNQLKAAVEETRERRQRKAR